MLETPRRRLLSRGWYLGARFSRTGEVEKEERCNVEGDVVNGVKEGCCVCADRSGDCACCDAKCIGCEHAIMLRALLQLETAPRTRAAEGPSAAIVEEDIVENRSPIVDF